jgi:hypothetical protein
MNSVDQRHAGAASGINNAVSRIAALLAVAVLGAMLNAVFQGALSRQMDGLRVAPAVRVDIEAQRSKLAAIETNDGLGRKAVEESFVTAFRNILWLASVLSIASSLSAAALISSPARSAPASNK